MRGFQVHKFWWPKTATGGPHAPVCFCYGDHYEGAGVTEAVKTGWELKIILFQFWVVWEYKGLVYIQNSGKTLTVRDGDKGAGKGWRRVV